MTLTSNPSNGNSYALAFLRIGVGILFLIFGQYKVFGTTFTLHGGFQFWINKFLEGGTYPFMAPILRGFVLPHATSIAFLVAYGAGHYRDDICLSIEPGEPIPFQRQDSLPRFAHLRHNPPAQGQRRHPIPANGEDSVSEQTGVRGKAWSSTAPPGEFRTYIAAEESPKEFTIRAVILGALFGLLFGAVTVYVGLRAGLTVSASIPISVLSISILRKMGV